MIHVKGKTASAGIAIGSIYELTKKKRIVRKSDAEDVETELARFAAAKKKAIEELRSLYEKALVTVGEETAEIFRLHQMMLEDEAFCARVQNNILVEQVSAEFAVVQAGNEFSEIFAETEDEYLKARAADVEDVFARLLRILDGYAEETELGDEAVILLADDLSPSETIQLDRSKILAFVTRAGSVNSHTAILARMMNVPALVCAPVEQGAHGRMAVVDGKQGELILDPDEKTIAQYREKCAEEQRHRESFFSLKGKKTETKSGKRIRLYANIGSLSDIDSVWMNDAEGIGLFRSEFLYLQKQDYPTEEEQFLVYKKAAELMAGKRVVIRTLDIGADKKVDYFHLDEEENPALGYRGVRICLERPEIFVTQLRALYRASAYGTVAIMVPMIASLWEVRRVKEIAAEVKKELDAAQIPSGNPEFGIMIETPAAAMMADELAREVDFFSIGTNDLTQYTLAVDRRNVNLDMFYDAHHPAVFRMIQMVIDSAHKAGIRVGICGELAADTSLTERLVGMGVDELSVAPAMVLPVRERVIQME